MEAVGGAVDRRVAMPEPGCRVARNEHLPCPAPTCAQAELDAEGASPGAAGPPRLHGSPAGVDGTGPSGPCLMGGDSCKSAEHPVADPEAEPNRCVVCFSDISQEEAIPSEDCPCHWEQFCSRCMDTMRQSTLDKLTVLRCPLCRDVLPAVELQSGQLTGILHNLVLSRGDLDLDGARAVSRLLQGGADPNARVPGGYHNTAIHIAGINGHGELVRVLAEWGQTDLNVANYAQQVRPRPHDLSRSWRNSLGRSWQCLGHPRARVAIKACRVHLSNRRGVFLCSGNGMRATA